MLQEEEAWGKHKSNGWGHSRADGVPSPQAVEVVGCSLEGSLIRIPLMGTFKV